MGIETFAPVGSWVWLVDADQVFADRALASYFGLNSVQAANGLPIKAFLESVHRDDLESVEEAIREASMLGGPFSHTYRVLVAGEWRRILAAGACFQPAGGPNRLFPGWVADVNQVIDGNRQALDRIHYMVSKAKSRSGDWTVTYTLDDALLSIEELLRGN